ncbi:interleukin enhancer-binding factor 2-like protein [Euroglyphus maynei]|uniref:Interleukin enhancer-binding factor 2-like protein n=1 Tax=Euroglyphus maynei TaxID=6958 RepID=A0A1Y3B1I4_EURMA|nr:interleukin enhancer-binding factor 2-like protein [Euroglyphus maynei]
MTCIRGINGEDHLPIHLAFKRLLQLLSSGIFLPYSAGIIDPCEPKMPIHGKLSVYDQEAITRQAQTLLRLLNYHNGCRYIFGLEQLLTKLESNKDSDNSSSKSSDLVDKYIVDQILSNDGIEFRKSCPVFDSESDTNQKLSSPSS